MSIYNVIPVAKIPENNWMKKSTRIIGGNQDGKNLFVFPPNAMMYHIIGLGKYPFQILRQISKA